MAIERSNLPQGSEPRVGTVPVPNTVLDELMPVLRDTELRVLLVVIRQTLGWLDRADAAGGRPRAGRKRRDHISHSQLCRRTGRASAAVSAAVASLVQQGLIVVEDTAGTKIATPAERRRHLGRQFFRPSGPAMGITAKIGG